MSPEVDGRSIEANQELGGEKDYQRWIAQAAFLRAGLMVWLFKI
jgi:hypothetical protein